MVFKRLMVPDFTVALPMVNVEGCAAWRVEKVRRGLHASVTGYERVVESGLLNLRELSDGIIYEEGNLRVPSNSQPLDLFSWTKLSFQAFIYLI